MSHPQARSDLLLVSAHPLALEELRRLVGPSGARATCRRFEQVLEDPALAREARTCLVDAYVPRPSRDTLIGEVLREAPACGLLVLADGFDEQDGAQLLLMGVKGLVRYADAADQLPRAVEAVSAGGYWAPRTLIAGVVDSIRSGSRPVAPTRPSARLSRREEEVLSALLLNVSNKEIAQRLNISERTVKFHVSNLLSKFRVTRRADLILEALQPLRRPL